MAKDNLSDAKYKESQRKNSLYRYGNIELLSLEQDEKSFLWKIKIISPENSIYVVSKEFDKSKGIFANAPESVILNALLDYSDSLIGYEMSLYDLMTHFIDYAFSDEFISKDSENAVWLSLNYPSFNEMEDAMTTFNARFIWFPEDSYEHEIIHDLIFKTQVKGGTEKLSQEVMSVFKANHILSGFLSDDPHVEKVLHSRTFENFPLFKSQYSKTGEFSGFSYMPH